MRTLKTTLLAVSALALATGASAEQIGVASNVSDQVTGTLGAQSAQIGTGDAVFHNQVLISDGNGSAQFLFIDETVFSLGPNSHVTLDEFIYNPSQGAGTVILNVSQGAFRFITGSARPESYTVRTPTATIGMRGTIFKGLIDAGLAILELIQGKLYVCPVQGATLESAAGNIPLDENGCALIEDPGTYYAGYDASNAAGGGPGDPGDPDNPNDAIDNVEDPFEREEEEEPCDECYFFNLNVE